MMGHLIKRLCLFWLVLLAGFFAYSRLSRLLLAPLLAPECFRLPPGIHTVIAGDSHGECALDPALIPGSVNYSYGAEHYLLTYHKLRHVLAANAGRVRRVVVGLSPVNLSATYDPYLWEHLPKYLPLVDGEAIAALDKRDLVYWRLFLGWRWSFPVKENLLRILWGRLGRRNWTDLPFWGFFYSSRQSNLNRDSLAMAIGRHFYRDGAAAGFSRLQERYLRKIQELCQEHGVRLFLFSGPLHADYREAIPLPYRDRYQKTLERLGGRHGAVVLDYSRFAMPDSFYGDGDHGNYFAAQAISPLVAARLE